MTPVTEEIKLNYQFSLLANSVFNVDDDTSAIVDDTDIVDVGGLLDPEAPEFFVDEQFNI